MITNSFCRVRNNQNSPLLRLPPEIRNRIWEYTLGHTTFGINVPFSRYQKPTIKRPSNEPIINTALLRSCRHIYLEAALIPMRLNTFVFHDGTWMIKRAMKLLKTHQWRNIKNIRFVISSPNMWPEAGFGTPVATKGSFTRLFPAAKHVEVVLHPACYPVSTTMAEAEACIRHAYSLLLQDRSISLTVKELTGLCRCGREH
jgi:hypothetical protein